MTSVCPQSDPKESVGTGGFATTLFDGRYEPLTRRAPLNMPGIACLLIDKNEGVDIVRGVQGEASGLS